MSQALQRIPQAPAALGDELIESRIGVHDRHHFEVKLDYSIAPGRRTNKYRVQSWFFVPRSLGINRHTYPRDQFYSDVQAYIRFKTPDIPLRTAADALDPLSPLAQILRLVGQLREHPRDDTLQQRLSYELRMFGCVVRSELRDRVRVLRQGLEQVAGGAERPVLFGDRRQEWRGLLDELERLIGAWRGARPDFTDPRTPRATRETWHFVDEYISLVVEEKLTAVNRYIDATPALASSMAAERARTRDLLIAERRYREGAGYASVVRGGDDEAYVFRRGMLKKFVMSVLWLEISKEKSGTGAANVGAAIAAGAAMAFALAATVLSSRWWVADTASFVIVGTIVYMLKDRIKEWLKQFFSARMSAFLADYSEDIRDPATGARLGRCRETFQYARESELPAEVVALRHRDAKTSIEAQAKPEVVMSYVKEVQLEGSALAERTHLEDYDLNDIIRFGVQALLARADDPQTGVALYEEDSDRVQERALPKVYHVNVVMMLRAESAPDAPAMKRIRVVLDKTGIRRLEEVA